MQAYLQAQPLDLRLEGGEDHFQRGQLLVLLGGVDPPERGLGGELRCQRLLLLLANPLDLQFLEQWHSNSRSFLVAGEISGHPAENESKY